MFKDRLKCLNLFLLLLILLQPLFDVWTFWILSADVPNYVAYIRIVILFLYFIVVFIAYTNKKTAALIIAIYAGYMLIHFAMQRIMTDHYGFSEIERMGRFYLMPITALFLIMDGQKREKAFIRTAWYGLFVVAVISMLVAFLSLATATNHPTYNKSWIRVGLNGWFYSSNAQSIILFTVIPFFMLLLTTLKKYWPYVAGLAASGVVLFFNGTRVAYLGLLLTYGFIVFVLLTELPRKRMENRKQSTVFMIIAASALLLSVFFYPYSITYQIMHNRQTLIKNFLRNNPQVTIEPSTTDSTNGSGKPIDPVSPDQPDPDPDEKIKYLISVMPNNKIEAHLVSPMYQYLQSASAVDITNKRYIQRAFVHVVMEQSGWTGRIFGHGSAYYSQYVDNLESDFAAIYGYYGYAGLLFYFLPVIWLIGLIFARLIRQRMRRLLNIQVLVPGVMLVALFGVAYFAGRALQQPNTSFYLSLMIALLYTGSMPESGTDLEMLALKPDCEQTV